MEVLELKMSKKKKITAYIVKSEREDIQTRNPENLIQFIKEKNIKFITVDFNIDMKEFKKTGFAKTLDKLKIPYYQVNIPEYAMGYIYGEITEKEELMNELCDEYETMDDKESLKGESLKNWIDMLQNDIMQKEIYISLQLRPQWIVKKMLDFTKNFEDSEINYLHFVQTNICEDICPQITKLLREIGVNVINYNVKKNLKVILTKN
ncbi:MAG: hypothetical protein ACTSVV_00565 [Promethearchaeota archaeon]